MSRFGGLTLHAVAHDVSTSRKMLLGSSKVYERLRARSARQPRAKVCASEKRKRARKKKEYVDCIPIFFFEAIFVLTLYSSSTEEL